MRPYFCVKGGFMPKDSPPPHSNWSWSVLLGTYFLIVVGMTFVVLAISVAPWVSDFLNGYFADPLLFLLNLIPLALIFLFLWALFGRLRSSFFVFSLLALLFATSSLVKLYFRGEGLVYTDLTLLPELFQVAPWYLADLGWAIVAFLLITFFFFCFLLWAIAQKLPAQIFSWPVRLLLLALSSLLFMASFYGPYRDADLYYGHAANWDYSMWVPFDNTRMHGTVYTFMWQSRNLPENLYIPQRQAAEKILAPYPPRSLPKEQKVDLIFYQMESFKDFTKHNPNLLWQRDPYASWHALEAQAVSGSILSRVYGGGTVETETSILGGHIRKPSYDRPRHSMASYLKSQGYYNEAAHPNSDVFYSRTRIYPSLGFDRFYSADDYFDVTEGTLYSDADLVKDTMTIYRQGLLKDEPSFLYIIGIDNHGPYPADAAYDTPFYLYDEDADPDELASLNLYFEGVERTALAMNRLYLEIQQETRPIVLVAFGDHAPAFSNMQLEVMGLDSSLSSEEHLLLNYEVPIIVLANSAAKDVLAIDFNSELGLMEPAFVFPKIFHLFDWSGSSRIQFLQEFSENIPAFREDRIFSQDSSRMMTEEDLKRIEDFKTLDLYDRRQTRVDDD